MIRIDCHKCKFYKVTWDRFQPHGCRAMRFKSRPLPSVVVYRSSGSQCLLFQPKDRRGEPTPGLR